MMEIFSKTWEIFSKTMEIFQKTWEFFSEQRRFIPKPRTIEQAAWSIPLQYFARTTSSLESLARKRENTALKSVTILSPRAGARPRTLQFMPFCFHNLHRFPRNLLCIKS